MIKQSTFLLTYSLIGFSILLMLHADFGIAREKKAERLKRHMIYREFLLELEQRFYAGEQVTDEALMTLLDQSISHLNSDEQTQLKEEFKSSLLEKSKVQFSDVLAFKKSLFKISRFDTAPARGPNLENALFQYQEHCASCHGAAGDGRGVLAKKMQPAPTDFSDVKKARWASPLRHLNILVLGVKGTAMRGYLGKLSLNDLWDLSFFTVGISFSNQDSKSPNKNAALTRKSFIATGKAPGALPDVTLEQLAIATNTDLWMMLNSTKSADQLQQTLPPEAWKSDSPLAWLRRNLSFSGKTAR